jgi:hypothetical protein
MMETAQRRARVRTASDIAFGRAWHRAALNICVELAGLPALVTVIANYFTQDQSKLAICASVALLVAIGLRFFPTITEKHALSLVLPWLIVLGLASVLFLVLVWSPKRNADLAQSWLTWQKSVETSTAKCKGKQSPEVEVCLSQELAPVLSSRPGKSADTALTRLTSGVMAGQVLLANQIVSKVLHDRLSVDERFIGTGNSEPVNSTSAAAAKVPEYLVPNLPVSDRQVWVWKLSPEDLLENQPLLDHPLKDVLLNEPPEFHANHEDFKTAWSKWIERDHLNSSDSPVLVRFASLDPTNKPKDYPPPPSGCLGKPLATRVFMNTLSPLLDEPLRLAAKDSGYSEEVRKNPDVKLYVWVWVPEEEVTQATWENVLNRLTTWIQAPACQPSL